MNWNLEGKRVIGHYINSYMVCGDVIESRVTYGGTVKHTIKLVEPRMIYGDIRDTLILKDNEITEVWIPDSMERTVERTLEIV